MILPVLIECQFLLTQTSHTHPKIKELIHIAKYGIAVSVPVVAMLNLRTSVMYLGRSVTIV